jgi:hypothetical protein
MGRPGSRGTGRAFSNVGGSKVMMGTDFILLIMANPRDRLPREKLQSCAHNSTEPAAPLIAKSFSIAAFLTSLGILPSYAIVASHLKLKGGKVHD